MSEEKGGGGSLWSEGFEKCNMKNENRKEQAGKRDYHAQKKDVGGEGRKDPGREGCRNQGSVGGIFRSLTDCHAINTFIDRGGERGGDRQRGGGDIFNVLNHPELPVIYLDEASGRSVFCGVNTAGGAENNSTSKEEE